MAKKWSSADMPGSTYRDRLRIRVNGLLVRDDALLMAKIHSPVSKSYVWMPPGGGLKFGETAHQCLQREFKEETGLQVEVRSLRHVNELVQPPYHAIEFYFDVRETGGKLVLGSDPEHPGEEQLLKEMRFIPIRELSSYSTAPEYLADWLTKENEAGNGGIKFSKDELPE